MAHHRLFIGLRPPAAVRAHLLSCMGGIAEARWQNDDQLHCTLCFLGELDRHRAEDVAAALGGLRHPPIHVRLDGVGSFLHAGRIQALWVGLAPREALKALHDKIRRLISHVGLPVDDRAYRPHITLARFSQRTAPTADAEKRIARPEPMSVQFDDVRLYESLLGTDGATYEVVARYPLA